MAPENVGDYLLNGFKKYLWLAVNFKSEKHLSKRKASKRHHIMISKLFMIVALYLDGVQVKGWERKFWKINSIRCVFRPLFFLIFAFSKKTRAIKKKKLH